MMIPKLSIVSVTYEDLIGIAATLRSLVPLVAAASGEVEVIVCDGGTPGIERVVPEEIAEWTVVSSIVDRGIYDAMNRGLRLSAGAHVWFLNGGDTSLESSWNDLRQDLESNQNCVLLYGFERSGPGGIAKRSPRNIAYIRHALPTSHQAIVYPGASARMLGYDLSYSVAADYAFTAAVYTAGHVWVRVERTVARFELGGVSTQRARDISRDAQRVQREILHTSKISRARSRARHALSRLRQGLVGR